MIRKLVPAVAVVLLGVLIGCGGSTDDGSLFGSTGTATSSTATAGSSGTNTNGGSTGFTLSTAVGSYSGTFAGSNTQNFTYNGSGTGSISANGTANFSYAAQTVGTFHYAENRSFNGTVDSAGNFTGYTPQASTNGGSVQQFPATGTITQSTGNQISVHVTWAYPYSNGGTFYTSNENWTMTKQ